MRQGYPTFPSFFSLFSKVSSFFVYVGKVKRRNLEKTKTELALANMGSGHWSSVSLSFCPKNLPSPGAFLLSPFYYIYIHIL